jgi:sugar phosphate isomerase/epimerase
MAKRFPLGICTRPELAATVADEFDYLELVVANLSPLDDDETFAPRLSALRATPLPIRAFNSFIPAQIKVVGEAVDWPLVERYVNTSIRRAATLGAQTIVFGSGGARAVPQDFPRVKAWMQLVRFLTKCADLAEEQGVTIAIEPLNRAESNIINTYLEGVQLAEDVNRRGVRVLADIYHFMQDDEPLEDLLQAPEWLSHVHLADTGRRHPGSGQYPLRELFALLREIDYRGAASIECSWGDDFGDEAHAAARFLDPLVA